MTLTPAANTGYKFDGWAGDCTGLTCSLTMGADHSVSTTWYAGISGHVTASTGGAVAGMPVTLYTDAVSKAIATTPASATTDASGWYALYAAPGSYRLQFGPVTGYAELWWAAGTDYTSASLVTLASTPLVKDVAVTPTHTITGTVTGSDTSAGVSGATVTAYSGSVACCSVVTSTTTDAFGHYSLTVTDGSYRLGFAATGYFSTYWGGSSSVTVAVSGADLAGKDAVLPRAYVASGHVVDGSGTAVANVSVAASSSSSGFGTTTNASGDYQLPVTAGSYRFLFTPPAGTTLAAVYSGGALDYQTASLVVMSANTTVNATLPGGFSVAIAVVGPDGVTPIGSASVQAYRSAASPLGNYATTAVTDGAGLAGLQLASSETYRLLISPPSGSTLAKQLYGDGGSPELATVIGSSTSAVNVKLLQGHLVTGHVTASAAAVSGANVTLLPATCSTCSSLYSTSSDAAGAYSVRVPDGDYKLRVIATGYPVAYYGGATFSAATTVTVGGADLSGIDVALTVLHQIAGTVTTTTGAGIAGVAVEVKLGGAAPCCSVVGSTTTDATGHYTVTVSDGTYKLYFSPPAGYFAAYWSATTATGALDFASATDIVLSGANATANTELASGYAITGHVTRASDGTPVAGSYVEAKRSSDASQAATATSDAAGAYTLTVPAGTYRLIAHAPYPDTTLANLWWSGQVDFSTATDLTVSANASAIDFALPAGYSVSGTITDALAAPVSGAMVTVLYDPLPGPCTVACFAATNSETTDAAGHYTLKNVPNGTYHLILDVGGTTYYAVVGGAATTDGASPTISRITVSGVSLTAIDTHLP